MIYCLTAHFVFTSSNTHMLCVYISTAVFYVYLLSTCEVFRGHL